MSRSLFVALALLTISIFTNLLFDRSELVTVSGEAVIPTLFEGADFEISIRQKIGRSIREDEKIDELLNYNIARSYTLRALGGRTVDVYIAYWEPGRQHERNIGDHTPDICWTQAGWEMSIPFDSEINYDNDTRIPAFQNRVFTKDGVHRYTWYSHLVGGTPSPYSRGELSIGNNWKADFLRDILEVKREQYFIRISANWNMVQNQSDNTLLEIINLLRRRGILTEND